MMRDITLNLLLTRFMACLPAAISCLFLTLLLTTSPASAKGTYQTPEDFIQQAFDTHVPEPELIWIKGELQQQIETILQHRYNSKRVRYWRKAQRSVWILEEIGKKKPITVGIVIDQNKISQLKVLVFRETRGWEVRYPFFTQQFKDLYLTDEHELSNSIDGISGATLSVRALNKLARIALLLNNISAAETPKPLPASTRSVNNTDI